uniref:Uncharacterized protein n=1 Tax=Populus trichocarpa TaxID=3694 RepID=A0A3N7G030_POPTR
MKVVCCSLVFEQYGTLDHIYLTIIGLSYVRNWHCSFTVFPSSFFEVWQSKHNCIFSWYV